MSKELASMESERQHAEWIVVMDNEIYTSLPREIRQSFKSASIHYPDEHKYLMENDPMYEGLYTAKRRSNKQLEEIKFNHREKQRNVRS